MRVYTEVCASCCHPSPSSLRHLCAVTTDRPQHSKPHVLHALCDTLKTNEKRLKIHFVSNALNVRYLQSQNEFHDLGQKFQALEFKFQALEFKFQALEFF